MAARAQRLTAGLCLHCGKGAWLPALTDKGDRLCELCYCRKTAKFNLGSSRHGPAVRDKFRTQDARCPYSGETLILGVNATLDHILPVSRYPERRTDPANVEWVVSWVNLMKGDATPDEFIERMRHILVYRSR